MSTVWKCLPAVLMGMVAGLGMRSANAAIERIDIIDHQLFADGHSFAPVGAYEKFRGKALIAVDPTLKRNQVVVDIQHVPVDADGKIRFQSEFILLRPISPTPSSTLLYDVNNRGGIAILGQINGQSPLHNDPTTLADAGDGFLMRHGFSLLFSAWTWDVAAQGPDQRPLILNTPVAVAEPPLQGLVENEFIVNSPTAITTYAGQRGLTYEPINADDPDAVLTVRDRPESPATVLARSAWEFMPAEKPGLPGRVHLKTGSFQTSRIYTLTYVAHNPRVSGLGLLGIRDLLSFFKTHDFEKRPPYAHSMIFGISQSARLIGRMMRDGLDVDEAGQLAFDGAYLEVPGGGSSGGFNLRFAQPTRHPSMLEEHDYPSDAFPFTYAQTTDPVTQLSGSRFDHAKDVNGRLPKVVLSNTSAEYWNRDASLVHTTVDGVKDVFNPPSHVRVYSFMGAQHYVGRSSERFPYTACVSTSDHYLPMRALLLSLERWVTQSVPPPPSQVPLLAKRELVSVTEYQMRFPAGLGITPPAQNLSEDRLDFGPDFESTGIPTQIPPPHRAPFVTKVPAPDPDGNDRGGLRLLELRVPLGTHTGWNRRDASTGFEWATARFDGSFVPFARTQAERESAHDPRLSIAERYPSREDYLKKLRAAARQLEREGFLLNEDRERALSENLGLYDRLQRRDPTDARCAYLYNDQGKLQ